MATGDSVRVSDAERDMVAAQLREHYAQGRLTIDELRERIDLALGSRTRGDLDAVMADLPYTAPHRGLPSDQAQRAAWLPAGGWARGQWDGQGASGSGPGAGYRHSPFAILRVIPVLVAVWLLIVLAGALTTGGGTAPVIAMILAVLAALRWLVRRRRWFPGPVRPGRGPRRPRRW